MKLQIVLAVLIITNLSFIRGDDSSEALDDEPSDPADPTDPSDTPVEKPHNDVEYDENSGSTLNSKECTIDPPPTLDELANYYSWMDDYNVQWHDKHERLCKTVRVVHNVRKIDAHNKLFDEGKVSFKMAPWRETHLTHDEKREKYQVHTVEEQPEWRALPAVSLTNLPEPRPAVDWRTLGYVSTPQDQGGCGSCYAWSAIAALEAQVRKCNMTYEPLSVQSIVDCATVGVWGCSSGWPKWSYRWMMSTGIMTAKDYPYIDGVGQCKYNKSSIVGYVTAANSFVYNAGNATFMKKVVSAIGPVAVVICVDDSIWAYAGGVYKVDGCCTDIHHAVTVVGYGFDKASGLDYWIVKNSWGADWGLGGYIWWAMGTNQCIIERYIDWPTVRSLTGPCP